MTRLKAAGLDVDLQVLDNEASKYYKEAMVNKWKVKYQLVPPDIYRRNAAERAIRTPKGNLFQFWLEWMTTSLATFGLLVPQAEMTQNVLRPCTSDPTISAWENFNALGPMGIGILIRDGTELFRIVFIRKVKVLRRNTTVVICRQLQSAPVFF